MHTYTIHTHACMYKSPPLPFPPLPPQSHTLREAKYMHFAVLVLDMQDGWGKKHAFVVRVRSHEQNLV